jgi:hypothetical protein
LFTECSLNVECPQAKVVTARPLRIKTHLRRCTRDAPIPAHQVSKLWPRNSGNIQGTFRNIQEYSRTVAHAFREHSGCIQGKFSSNSGNIQKRPALFCPSTFSLFLRRAPPYIFVTECSLKLNEGSLKLVECLGESIDS